MKLGRSDRRKKAGGNEKLVKMGGSGRPSKKRHSLTPAEQNDTKKGTDAKVNHGSVGYTGPTPRRRRKFLLPTPSVCI